MSNILGIEWTIYPQTSPQPVLACSGCGVTRPFKSSSKIRLNANGKMLDGWLIYRCISCDHTWNRSVLRRKKVQDIAPATLLALQNSDPTLVRSIEFDRAGLRQITNTVAEFSEATVQKKIISKNDGQYSQIEIFLKLDQPSSLRLDRILSIELGLSRTRIHALFISGHLQISGDDGKILQRSLKNGTCLHIDLLGLSEANIIIANCSGCA